MARIGRRNKSNRKLLKRLKGREKATKKLNNWKVENMEGAIREYQESGGQVKISVLSRAWNVPRMTLNDRLKGKTKSANPSSGRKPIFDKETEKKFADFLIEMSRRGFGLSRADTRKLAFQYAENIRSFQLIILFEKNRKITATSAPHSIMMMIQTGFNVLNARGGNTRLVPIWLGRIYMASSVLCAILMIINSVSLGL